jgi:hypothetical protein
LPARAFYRVEEALDGLGGYTRWYVRLNQVAAWIRTTYTKPQQFKALKRVADTYYNIPRGTDFVKVDVAEFISKLPAAAPAVASVGPTVPPVVAGAGGVK